MKTRLGNTLYRAGLIGAVISLFYIVDAIWMHENGGSLLPIFGRFLPHENLLYSIEFGIVLALLSWGAGTAVRFYVNMSAE